MILRLRLFLVILFCFIAISCSNTGERLNDREELRLYGSVKSVEEFVFEVNEEIDDDTFSDTVSIEKIESNSEGYIVKHYFHENDGYMNKNEQIFYDSSGNETVRLKCNDNGVLMYKEESNYDRQENRIDKIRYDDDGIDAKYTYKHDRKGNIIESNYFRNGDIHIRQTFFKNDNKGNEIEMQMFGFESGFNYSSDRPIYEGKVLSEYDSRGNIISELHLDNYDEQYNRRAFEYDQIGNEIKSYYFDDNDLLVSKNVMQYDELGNLIHRDWYNSEGLLKEISKFSYQYDSQDNWIQKTFSFNDSLRTISKRVIKYF